MRISAPKAASPVRGVFVFSVLMSFSYPLALTGGFSYLVGAVKPAHTIR